MAAGLLDRVAGAVGGGDGPDRDRPAVDAARGQRGVGSRHVHRGHVDRAERERRVVVDRQVDALRQVRVAAQQRRAVGPGHPEARGRPDHVTEPDSLLERGVERVDRADRAVVDGVRLRPLRPLGVDDGEGRHVAAVAVVVRADRGRRGDPQVVAERQALLQRRHQREDLRRRAGLHARAGAVARVHRVVDGGVVRSVAEQPVLGDGPDLARAGLDQHLGVRVVARVVVGRAGRLDEVDRVLGGLLIRRVQGRVDLHAAGEVQRLPGLRVDRVVLHDGEHVVAEESVLPDRRADAAGLQRHAARYAARDPRPLRPLPAPG